jgi:nucleoside-diphosphate-sugar epimerase
MTTQAREQTVFLTGATGAMGQAIARSLTLAGHTVIGVTRTAEGEELLRSMGATPVSVDIFDEDAILRATEGVDVIAHFATKIPFGFAAIRPGAWSPNDRLRTRGTRNLLAAARANGVRRFIFESYFGAYPDRGNGLIDERVLLEPVAPLLRSVIEGETMVNEFGAQGGEGVNLRFGNLYGPGRASDAYIALVQKRQMPIIGKGFNYISNIHVDDLGSALLHALTVAPGTYNVADDAPMLQTEYVRLVAASIGAPPPRQIPYPVARLMLDGLAKVIVGSRRLSNRRFREATGWHPQYPSAREGWSALAAVDSQRPPGMVAAA